MSGLLINYEHPDHAKVLSQKREKSKVECDKINFIQDDEGHKGILTSQGRMSIISFTQLRIGKDGKEEERRTEREPFPFFLFCLFQFSSPTSLSPFERKATASSPLSSYPLNPLVTSPPQDETNQAYFPSLFSL